MTTLTSAQQNHILNIVRRAARTEIMPRFRTLSSADISTKSRPDDLVTVADVAAEKMITRALNLAFPDALVVGEEAVSEDNTLVHKIAEAPLAFIIDPIDGTWNFAHGLAVFGVILAVTHKGVPVFGLIYDPVHDDWAIADTTENSALLVRADGVTKPLESSRGKPLEELSGYIPFNHYPDAQKRKLAGVLPTFARTHTLLCSAHEYRMIAQGHTDFLITATLNPWDHAAGALIAQRAGAHVEMLGGDDYSAAKQTGHLLVAPDKSTWDDLANVFSFLVD